VILGLLAGEAVVISLIWTGHDPFMGLNAGFVGLVVNGTITLVSLAAARGGSEDPPYATPPPVPGERHDEHSRN
jgi:SSS family solute:Na+ symporter